MGSLKLSVHPLFFLFGVYYAITGRIFIFIIFTLTAVIHELGHSITAKKLGYKLDKIVLMPFGAVVKGEIEGLKCLDQIKVSLSGPLVNLIVAVIVVASWWVAPITYAYTDTVVMANLSMAVINLFPAFPLDGGRVLYALLSNFVSAKACRRTCKILAIFIGFCFLTLFVLSIFNTLNLSLLFFTLFIFVGAFSNKSQSKYVKIYSGLSEARLKRGIKINRQAISSQASVKKLLSILDENSLNEFVVYKDGQRGQVLDQVKINKIIESGDIYSKIEKYL